MKKRFQLFKQALAHETGDVAKLLANGETVIVLANEFSPQQTFSSVQSAIDHYKHLGGYFAEL